jgi:hypothetical protein
MDILDEARMKPVQDAIQKVLAGVDREGDGYYFGTSVDEEIATSAAIYALWVGFSIDDVIRHAIIHGLACMFDRRKDEFEMVLANAKKLRELGNG